MIKPIGSILTLVASASSINVDLVVDSVAIGFATEAFQRMEFSNSRRNSAKNTAGATAMIMSAFGNIPVQVSSTCQGGFPVLDLAPDDDNIDDIRKQFNITRFSVQGAPSLSANIDQVQLIANDHKQRLARFQKYLGEVGMDISVTEIDLLRLETFSYLTSTSASVAGNSLITSTNSAGYFNQILIIDFNQDVEYESKKADGTKQLVKSWSSVIEIRTITVEGSPV